MRLVIFGITAIAGAAWFLLSAIHSAWMSATPVPDPTLYERNSIVYLLLTAICLFSGLGAFVAAWLKRRGKTQSRA